MTFPVSGIPAATDVPSQSQGQIQTNFNNIIGWSGVDHIEYGETGAGTHFQATFLEATSPTPTASGTIGVLYSLLDTSSASQLAFVNKTTTFQLTGSVTTATNSAGKTEYTIITPFGLTLKFGVCSASNLGVPFSFGSNFAANGLGVVLTPRFAGAITIGANSLDASGFTAYLQSGPGTQDVYYFAWGN